LCAFPTLVFAQAILSPQGGEYAISGERAGDQTGPAVAIGGAGGWVVFQDNGIDRQGLGIAGRRLDSSLNPSGTVFPVNSLLVGDQEKPAIALLNDGGAAIAWQGGVAGFQQVYARFIHPDGSFVSDDVLVSQPTLSKTFRITTNMMVYRSNRLRPATLRMKETVRLNQERTGYPAVATLTDGTVVVAHTSSRKVFKNSPVVVEQVKGKPGRERTNSVVTYVPFSSDSWQDVYFQRFTATGQKLGAEVMANQFTAFNQRSPAVTALGDGSFLMSWVSEEQRAEASTDVMARRFGTDGSPLGNEFRVSTSDLVCNSPAAAPSAGGGFTLVWSQKDAVRTNGFDIYARAYDLSGTPAGEPFRLNSYQAGNQHTPRITSAPAGQMVVWTSVGQDGSGEGVYGRTLNGGTVIGDEFRVNSTIYLRQFTPTIAADSGNRAIVIWSSYQTMAGFDLFGQRYAVP
ncbi:MAG TPA: hypothetical protein VGF13_08525, partial [Verrucomicrobiae bacterium]